MHIMKGDDIMRTVTNILFGVAISNIMYMVASKVVKKLNGR